MEIRVRPIRNGTVIDHISSGNALRVLRILGITGPPLGSAVSVAMHVPSEEMGFKDLVKLEDKELKKEEVDKIALISPKATINIIRDERVVTKEAVELPEKVVGIVKCSNPNCITNQVNPMTKSTEPVQPEFIVLTQNPVTLKCDFCDRLQMEIEENLA